MPVNNGERAAASIRCEPSDGLVRNLLRAPIVDDCEQPIAPLRFAAGVILLLPVVWFTWLTVDGLAARRQLRTDLAEITHVRYGLLSADRWRDIIAPIPQFDHSDENATVSDTKKFSQVVQLPMNYRGGSDSPLQALVPACENPRRSTSSMVARRPASPKSSAWSSTLQNSVAEIGEIEHTRHSG